MRARSVSVPGNYEAWVSWLDAYARGEDLPNTHLLPLDDEMGPHMLSRLIDRVARAFEARTARWNATLQRDVTAGATGGHTALAAALVAARGRLAPLVALSRSPLLPSDLRANMASSLESALRSVQESLEDSAHRGRDREMMLALVRDNCLLATLSPPSLPRAPTPRSPAPGRRVIL